MFDAPTPLLLPSHQESQNIPTIAYDYPLGVTLEVPCRKPYRTLLKRTESKRMCAIALYCVLYGLPRLPYMLSCCVPPRAILKVLYRSSSICSVREFVILVLCKVQGVKKKWEIIPLNGCQGSVRYLLDT